MVPAHLMAADLRRPCPLPACVEQSTLSMCYIVETLQTEVSTQLALVQHACFGTDRVKPSSYSEGKHYSSLSQPNPARLFFKVIQLDACALPS